MARLRERLQCPRDFEDGCRASAVVGCAGPGGNGIVVRSEQDGSVGYGALETRDNIFGCAAGTVLVAGEAGLDFGLVAKVFKLGENSSPDRVEVEKLSLYAGNRVLAEAVSVPIETLDLALANWSQPVPGSRATLGVRSERRDGYLLEVGPNTVRPAPELWRLIESLGLAGEVGNLPGGEVGAVAEGERQRVEEFVAWCRRGPPSAQVEDVQVRYGAPQGTFRTFKVAR